MIKVCFAAFMVFVIPIAKADEASWSYNSETRELTINTISVEDFVFSDSSVNLKNCKHLILIGSKITKNSLRLIQKIPKIQTLKFIKPGFVNLQLIDLITFISQTSTLIDAKLGTIDYRPVEDDCFIAKTLRPHPTLLNVEWYKRNNREGEQGVLYIYCHPDREEALIRR